MCVMRLCRSQIYLQLCEEASFIVVFLLVFFTPAPTGCLRNPMIICMINMYFNEKGARWTRWSHVDIIDAVLLCWKRLSCVVSVCACSPSGSSDGGAVRVGDGVAPEHRPGQELHLALLRERPAAGDVSHRCLGDRTTVSFNAPPHHHTTPSWSF